MNDSLIYKVENISQTDMKKCNRCKNDKLPNEFNLSAKFKDGLDFYCKQCRKEKYAQAKQAKKIVSTNKLCLACEIVKPISEFYSKSNEKDGHAYYCKPCDLERSKAYRDANKQKISIRRKEKLKNSPKRPGYRVKTILKNAGLTLNHLEQLKIEQDNKCAICLKPAETERYKTLCLDHNHFTNQVRGLLCNTHNRTIGLLKENVDDILKIVSYLQKYQK